MSLLGIGLALLALILIGIPIAISLGLVAVLAMITGPGGAASLPNAGLVMYSGATSFPLIAIPLFILAGAIMNASGISGTSSRLTVSPVTRSATGVRVARCSSS